MRQAPSPLGWHEFHLQLEGMHRGLSDWLDWTGLIDTGAGTRFDRFIG